MVLFPSPSTMLDSASRSRTPSFRDYIPNALATKKNKAHETCGDFGQHWRNSPVGGFLAMACRTRLFTLNVLTTNYWAFRQKPTLSPIQRCYQKRQQLAKRSPSGVFPLGQGLEFAGEL